MSDVTILARTQYIVVDPVSHVISVINAGPQGPAGPPGATGGGEISYFDLIDHGAIAATARTVGVATDGSEPILWRGTVEPTNAVNGDDWLDYS